MSERTQHIGVAAWEQPPESKSIIDTSASAYLLRKRNGHVAGWIEVDSADAPDCLRDGLKAGCVVDRIPIAEAKAAAAIGVIRDKGTI